MIEVSKKSQKEIRESLEDCVDLDVWERRVAQADKRGMKGGKAGRIQGNLLATVIPNFHERRPA